MARRRRNVEAFSLSFLDCICCGFGAIILLLVLTKIGEPRALEQARLDLGVLGHVEQGRQHLTGKLDRDVPHPVELLIAGKIVQDVPRPFPDERLQVRQIPRGEHGSDHGNRDQRTRSDFDSPE